MYLEILHPSPIQKIVDPAIADYGVNLFVKRDDLLHTYVSGNKWRKIKYNLIEAKSKGYETILSFGGAYSNHIYALAAACKQSSLGSIGIIRGEKTDTLNPTLKFATTYGMKLNYISRSEYRLKETDEFLKSLEKKYGRFYLLPEGGTNELALLGCQEIVKEIQVKYDYICCPCGTGGTFSGIASKNTKNTLGFCVLKGQGMLDGIIQRLLQGYAKANWSVNYDYHFGGYAKITKDLLDFTTSFNKINGFELDPIYTGKMMFGIYDLIKKGYFKKGETIIALHTGGLQAWKGFMPKIEKIKKTSGLPI